MKTVLVLVHADEGQEARLKVALALAKALGGHLHCVDVVAFPTMAQDPTGLAAGPILVRECDAAARNRRIVEARLIREGVSWSWSDVAGSVAECLAREAGLADLIVVNTKRDRWLSTDPRGVATAVALKARCPVVAVPDHHTGFDPRGVAVVAWDGSRSAMAALRNGTPLLALARAVRIVTVSPTGSRSIEPGAPAEAARVYLARHSIQAKIVRETGDKVDLALLATCRELDAAYCLMGAYGHGRLTEDVLGGVTRRLLDAEALPLVLQH